MMKLIFFFLFFTQAWASTKSYVDPEVVNRLDEMGNYLRSLKEFKVVSNATFDIVLKNNQTIEFPVRITYKAKMPDKLYVQIKSQEKEREYYFTGENVTVYAPDLEFYGIIPTSGKFSEFVSAAHEYGLEMPLAELFYWGKEGNKKKPITSALFINEVKEGKKTYDHFAIRQGNIDWQVWVTQGKKPLPVRLLYITNDDPAKPHLRSEISWNTDPDFESSTFKFKPPKDSYEIKFKKQGGAP